MRRSSRDPNEETKRTSAALTADAGRERFACECTDAGGTFVICLTRAEYETVRAYSTHFVIVRDHENPECESVVRENDRWAIVEAVGKEAVMAARRSDPRADGPLMPIVMIERTGIEEATGETAAPLPAHAGEVRGERRRQRR